MIGEVLSEYGALIVYVLTAVAAIATIKASSATQKERLDEHLEQDRSTHEKLFQGLGAQNVQLARLEEKVDHVREDLKRGFRK